MIALSAMLKMPLKWVVAIGVALMSRPTRAEAFLPLVHGVEASAS
jgi:hypothetical protein